MTTREWITVVCVCVLLLLVIKQQELHCDSDRLQNECCCLKSTSSLVFFCCLRAAWLPFNVQLYAVIIIYMSHKAQSIISNVCALRMLIRSMPISNMRFWFFFLDSHSGHKWWRGKKPDNEQMFLWNASSSVLEVRVINDSEN